MKTGRFGCELTFAFKVGFGKVGFEVVHGVVFCRSFAPVLDGVGEETGVLKVGKGRADGSGFGDGIDGGGKETTLADLVPEVF